MVVSREERQIQRTHCAIYEGPPAADLPSRADHARLYSIVVPERRAANVVSYEARGDHNGALSQPSEPRA